MNDGKDDDDYHCHLWGCHSHPNKGDHEHGPDDDVDGKWFHCHHGYSHVHAPLLRQGPLQGDWGKGGFSHGGFGKGFGRGFEVIGLQHFLLE